jgi:hypothetical protein
MKIHKRAKPLPVNCQRCGSIFEPKVRDTYIEYNERSGFTMLPITQKGIVVNCPVCKMKNPVMFDLKTKQTIDNIAKSLSDLAKVGSKASVAVANMGEAMKEFTEESVVKS